MPFVKSNFESRTEYFLLLQSKNDLNKSFTTAKICLCMQPWQMKGNIMQSQYHLGLFIYLFNIKELNFNSTVIFVIKQFMLLEVKNKSYANFTSVSIGNI